MNNNLLAIVPMTPFFAAILIGWILSVSLHEFAHALVAYWGGDRSVRDRGYLSFNPINYIDPITSVLLPAVFLLMGGVPLPGGAVLIDRSALRSRAWESAVSAAGPAANVILFLVIAAILHATGWTERAATTDQPIWVRFLGVLAVLQIFSVLINLIPVPPFDGFGIIEPFFDRQTRIKFAQPQFRSIGFVLLFVLFFASGMIKKFQDATDVFLTIFGLPFELTWHNFNVVFFGSS